MRALICAVVVAAIAVGGIELLFRRVGGLPSVVPGLTRVEYQWKVQRSLRMRSVAYVVGDSRAGWGFAERVFNQEYERLRPAGLTEALNVGVPAASIGSSVKYVLDAQGGRRPQILIVNYSPVGLYLFLNDPGPPIPGLKLQDLFDDRLDSVLAQRLWTRGRPDTLREQASATRERGKVLPGVNWVRRTEYPDGFINGTLGSNVGAPVDAPMFQLQYFAQFVKDVRHDASGAHQRRREFIDVIDRARRSSWSVVLVRFPIGARMRGVEAELPAELQPSALASALGVPFIDYNTDQRTLNLPTVDESHLSPDGARALAPLLAQDLQRFLF